MAAVGTQIVFIESLSMKTGSTSTVAIEMVVIATVVMETVVIATDTVETHSIYILSFVMYGPS